MNKRSTVETYAEERVEEESTVHRRLLKSSAPPFSRRMTRRMERIDERLLAMVRGEDPHAAPTARPAPPVIRTPLPVAPVPVALSPVRATERVPAPEFAAEAEPDPFGGLIVVDDDIDLEELDDVWVVPESAPQPVLPERPRVSLGSVLRRSRSLAKAPEVPLDAVAAFLLARFDKARSLVDVIDGTDIDPQAAVAAVDELLLLGAVELL